MIGNIIFVIRTFVIIICEMCAYMFGRDKYVCTKNITQKLGNINLFYVKLFQSLSTNSQLLDQKQIEYLSNYTDNVPFNDEDIDNSFIKSIIIVGVINPDIAILLPNNPIPIKSGMIALVYEGRMRTGDKRKVIVKIIRKNIREKILDAIDKIEFLSKLIGGFPYIRNTNVKDLIQENRRMMIEQTDFNIEISNLQHMQENMKNIDYITIPRVYQEYTTENSNVIVMDYIEGKKLNELEECDKDEYSMMLAKFGMKCILFDRFYHADLHPGNIFFLCDKNGKKRLGIIDFGLMCEMSRDEQNYFYKFFSCLSNEDNYIEATASMMDYLIEPRDVLNALSDSDSKILLKSISYITENAFSNKKNFTPSDLFNVNKILGAYNLSLAKGFCKIELALAISESVSSKLSYNTTYLENVRVAASQVFDVSMFEY